MTLRLPREVKACRNLGLLNFYQAHANKISRAFVLLIRRLSKMSIKTKGVVAEKELPFNLKKKKSAFSVHDFINTDCSLAQHLFSLR